MSLVDNISRTCLLSEHHWTRWPEMLLWEHLRRRLDVNGSLHYLVTSSASSRRRFASRSMMDLLDRPFVIHMALRLRRIGLIIASQVVASELLMSSFILLWVLMLTWRILLLVIFLWSVIIIVMLWVVMWLRLIVGVATEPALIRLSCWSNTLTSTISTSFDSTAPSSRLAPASCVLVNHHLL
jgi:hypothetical protein